jgi:hypothetical protein
LNQAALANIVCPACAGRAARDLDNPIPGDDEPVEGGLPKPKEGKVSCIDPHF